MPHQQLDTIRESNALTAQIECSKDLFARLTDSGKTDDVVRELASSPSIRSAIVDARDALERRQRPCGAKGIAACVMPLTALYALPDRSEGEWATFWELYLKALGELPYEALAAAVEHHVRESAFFPKPAELYRVANPIAEKLRIAAWRAKRVVEYEPPQPRRITEEDRQRVRDWMTGFRIAAPPTPARSETQHEMAQRIRRMA